MSKYLSRDQILTADDRQYEDVECPEWSDGNGACFVRLRSLTGAERDEWEQSLTQQVGNKTRSNYRNARAKLIALSAVDKDGLPLFSKADVLKLGSKSAKPLDRLFEACQRLSGISDEDVKELEENFDSGPSGSSTSASRSPSAAAPSPNSSPAPHPGSSPSGPSTNGAMGHSVPGVMTSSPR